MNRKAICAFILGCASLYAQQTDYQPVYVPGCVDSCECCAGPQIARLTARHIEPGGIGYSDGYTSVDLFWAPNLGTNVYGFVDARGHLFNDGKWAANLGLGLRVLPDCADVVAGVNVYGDWRQARHERNFYQVGGGLELLWPCWDVRVNGYAPVGKTHESFKTGFQGFVGHEAITFKKWEVALWGVDAGLGYWLYRSDCYGLHATVGGYYFKGDFDKHAAGWLVRARLELWDWVELKGQVSYDKLFKWKGQGEIAVSFPFGCCVQRYQRKTGCCSTILNLEERLVEQPERFEIIVVADKKETAPALSPITGLPLQFFFVNNLASDGDGTFEHPFGRLVQAQIASSATDVIYVFPGDGTDRGMDVGIVLKDDQILTSSFLPFPIHSKFGNFVIPAMSTTRPLISNVNAVVTLANRDTVQGFRINGSSVGIFSFNSIEGFNLISNIMNISSNTGSAIGVDINAFTGRFFAKDNTISTATAAASSTGIVFSGSVVNGDVELLNNVISAKSSLDQAVGFAIQGPSFTGNLQMTNNQIEALADQVSFGIFISSFQGTAALTGNEIKVASANNEAVGFTISTGFNGNLNLQGNSIEAASGTSFVDGVQLNNFVGTFSLLDNTIATAGNAGQATDIKLLTFNGKFTSQNNQYLAASQAQDGIGILASNFNGNLSSTSDQFSVFSNNLASIGVLTQNQFTGELNIQKSTISSASNTNIAHGIELDIFTGTFFANSNSISVASGAATSRGIFLATTFNGEFNVQNNSIMAASPTNGVGISNLAVFTGDLILLSNQISSQHSSGLFVQSFSGTMEINNNTMTQSLPTAMFAVLNISGSSIQARIVDNVLTSTASNNRAFIMSNTAGTSHLKLDRNILSSPAFTDDGNFTNTAGTFEVESTNGSITGVEAMNNNARLTQTGVITYVPVQ